MTSSPAKTVRCRLDLVSSGKEIVLLRESQPGKIQHRRPRVLETGPEFLHVLRLCLDNHSGQVIFTALVPSRPVFVHVKSHESKDSPPMSRGI